MPEKTPRENDDPYYDLIDDFDLVVASFQAQYGIRLSRDLRGMQWDEFRILLVGLGPETPLGRIISIRAEEDKSVLKHFSRDQHKIRNEWRLKKAKSISPENFDEILESMKKSLISMAGGGQNRKD